MCRSEKIARCVRRGRGLELWKKGLSLLQQSTANRECATARKDRHHLDMHGNDHNVTHAKSPSFIVAQVKLELREGRQSGSNEAVSPLKRSCKRT